MTTPNEQNEEMANHYYRLASPHKTLFDHLSQFIIRILALPYHLYQTVVGRLLSHLILNPLFRQAEKEEARLMQHQLFPDPLFHSADEMMIINVMPQKNIFLRMMLNWHHFFMNHTTTLRIAFSLVQRILHLFPSGETTVNRYLNTLVHHVASLVTEADHDFNPSQIHFRGLDQLSATQQRMFYKKLEERIGYDFRQNQKHVFFYRLQTVDNSVLDSVEVRGPHEAQRDITNRHFIVACMPRSNNFTDWLKQYQLFSRELDVTVVAFNYRGTGLSQGLVHQANNLYNDAYSQVQRLLQLGARPENIALMGECLGGNIATHTAGRLHQEKCPVKLYNARSFRSMTSILENRIIPSTHDPIWHPKTLLKWLFYGLVKFVLNPIVLSAGWSLNVEKQFLAIPAHDREFLVVRSKKDENNVRFRDDTMIPHKHASIYSLVKEQTKILQNKTHRGEVLSPNESEWLHDPLPLHKFHVSEALHAHAKKAEGHTAQARLLTPTNPLPNDTVDGRQYAFNFFKRVWEEEIYQQPIIPTLNGLHDGPG